MEWIFASTISLHNIIIELDLNGKIIDSYHDPIGQFISLPSEVLNIIIRINLGLYFLPFK